MDLTMRVALVAEECVGLVPLSRLGRAESACNVGRRRGRNGLAGLDGCYKVARKSSASMSWEMTAHWVVMENAGSRGWKEGEREEIDDSPA